MRQISLGMMLYADDNDNYFPWPGDYNSNRDADWIWGGETSVNQIKRSFAELTESGLIAKGREWKEELREERHHPAVMAAVVNYSKAGERPP